MNGYITIIKNTIKNIRLNLYIIISIITYLAISLSSIDNHFLIESPTRILGGFQLNQFPFSIYTLVWMIPKLMISYLLFIYIGNLLNINLFFSIIRIKSKIKWYILYNFIGLIVIIAWYVIGYITLNLVICIKLGAIYDGFSQNINMLVLDITFTYFIFNLVYLLGIVKKKVNLGIVLALILYVSPIFTNNPDKMIFKILPSNHAMILRHEYLSNSYFYIFILIIILLIIGCYLFKKTEF